MTLAGDIAREKTVDAIGHEGHEPRLRLAAREHLIVGPWLGLIVRVDAGSASEHGARLREYPVGDDNDAASVIGTAT